MHPVKSRVAQPRDQRIARTAHPAAVRATDVASGARAVLPAAVAFAPLALMVGAAVAAGSLVIAPALAALAVGLGLWLAYRGRSVLVASGVGLATYVVLAAGFAALP